MNETTNQTDSAICMMHPFIMRMGFNQIMTSGVISVTILFISATILLLAFKIRSNQTRLDKVEAAIHHLEIQQTISKAIEKETK